MQPSPEPPPQQNKKVKHMSGPKIFYSASRILFQKVFFSVCDSYNMSKGTILPWMGKTDHNL